MLPDEDKTKEQLISELEEIRLRLADLEALETEHKQVEEALRLQSEIIANMSEGVYLVRASDGLIVYTNPKFEEIFGYGSGEMVGKYVSIVNAPTEKSPAETAKEIMEIMIGAGVWQGEIQNIKKDGTPFWCYANVSYFHHPEHGRVLVAVHIDITQRKQMEETLKKTQDDLLKAQEIAKIGSWSWERDTDIGIWSEEMYCILGYTPGEIQPTFEWLLEIMHPDDREQVAKDIEESMRTGKPYGGVYRLTRKDGSEITVESRAKVVLNQAGEAKRMFGTVQDITERKQAEEELRESEERFRTLFNAGNDAVFVHNLTPDNMPDKFVEVNDVACQMLGYTKKELLQLTPFDIAAPKKLGQPPAVALMKRLLARKRVLAEAVFRSKDGRQIPVETNIRLFDFYGKPVVLTIARDITERQQAEEREKQLQQELNLSSRLAAIGELAAGVAHEINNPLTGIIGFSQRLLRKSADEGVKRDLERIHSEALRAAKVVDNLLTFARRRESKKQYTSINDIVQEALELRAYELKTTNIEIITNLAPNLPQIKVDFYQIEEVFLNIVMNAEQAMVEANRRGKLTIKTQKRKGYIGISFADDGPGIPAENLDKLFDPFFTTRGERGGTGLGLSVCHGIVAEHDGRIYARSKPGEGTTFFVELPLTTGKIDKNALAAKQLIRRSK